MPRSPLSTLRARVLALVLLVVTPFAVLLVATALRARTDAVETTQDRTVELAGLGAESVRQLLDRTEALLGTIGKLSTLDGPTCTTNLSDAITPGTPYANLFAVAPDGAVTCMAIGTSRIDDVSGEDWFRTTVERGTFTVTAPATALTARRQVIIASLPIRDPEGRLRAVVAASIEPSSLTAFTTRADLPADTAVGVVAADGTILDRVPDRERYAGQVAPLSSRLTGDPPTTTFMAKGVDGLERLYAGEQVPAGGTTLTVSVGLSRDVAYGPADRRLLASILAIVLVGLVGGILALLFARSALLRPLGRLRATINDLTAGDGTARVGTLQGPEEVTEVGAAFDAMADELEDRLRRLQILVAELGEASERERASIAAGLHDQSLQTLAALSIQLQLLRRRTDDAEMVAGLTRALDQTDATAAELRALLFELKPPALEQLGFAAALREIMEVKFGTSGPDFVVRDDRADPAPDWAELLLYRIAQEAIANVAAHSDARHVWVTIGAGDGQASLELRDDGKGFDPVTTQASPVAGHIGLRVMRDRARAAGGDVEIVSAPGAGTTVRAWVLLGPARETAPGPPPGSRRP